MRKKRVFVSGCFDMVHSGHIRFLEAAANYGDVYVGIGSDRTIVELKGHPPVTSERERQYVLGALRYVKKCFVNSGSGILDFIEELNRVSPDIFIVNEDGNTPEKAELCRRCGVQYVVLRRTSHEHFPVRSTTRLRMECRIPYRLDLAGGWLDQPFVSRFAAGPVINICIEPTLEFTARSGMASSTRNRAIDLWQTNVPMGNRTKLARVLFAYENPPGTTRFSGSQDAIGIVFPGLNRMDYDGAYWPRRIKTVNRQDVLAWLEPRLNLVPLGPRKADFNIFEQKRVTKGRVKALAQAADTCWQAILQKDIASFATAASQSFEAQLAMFPAMITADVRAAVKHYEKDALSWKLAGAGGGGYLVLISQNDIRGAIKPKICREGS